jgi:hypothetical protein
MLILLSVICGLGSAYLYFFTNLHNTDNNLTTQPQVATIKKIINDVRWKSSESLTWFPLKPNSAIHVGDSLFAGEKSNVSIKFLNNNEISLQSETLLVINKVENKFRDHANQIDVQLPYGQLELSSSGSTDWSIKTKNQQLQLKSMNQPTNIQIKKRKDFTVALKKGKAELKHNGSNQILTSENKVFSIPEEQKSIPKVAKTINLPIADELFTNEPVEQNKIIRAPSQITPEKPKDKNAIEIKTTINKIYKDSVLKEEKKNINSKYTPPKPKAPFNDNSIYFHKGNELKINFFWSRTPEAKSYLLQIATNALFKPILIEKNQSQNSVDIILKSDGKYHWRIKAIGADGESVWSEVHNFSVKYSN